MEENQKYKYLIKGGRHDDLKFVGETDDVIEAKKILLEYINTHIKKCYYQRIAFHEMHIWIDYGSWSDFIYVYFSDEVAKFEYFGGNLPWK